MGLDMTEDDIAYQRAKYPSRCMLCGQPIGRGALIVTPVDNTRITFTKKSKARWAHPPCMKKALREQKVVSAQEGRLAFRMRQLKKRRRNPS